MTVTETNMTSDVTLRAEVILDKEAYLSPDFAALEAERLWPRVWQVACREEEIPNTGDYVEYRILDESILVVRVAPDRIAAYYNACQHRGRRLAAGAGRLNHFRCPYHGWRWNLDGTCRLIVDQEDYPTLCPADVPLQQVRVDTWGGFVYVNMDPDAAPLLEWLAPTTEFLDPFEFQKMRYRWYKTVILPCNWKTVLEAFIEAYHVQTTHPQLLRYNDDRTLAVPMGRHGMFTVPPDYRGMGVPAPRLKVPDPPPARDVVREFIGVMEDQLAAIWAPRDIRAADLLESLPDNASWMEVMGAFALFQQQIAEEEGAGWPAITPEQVGMAGIDWHVFPNQVGLYTPGAALFYRFRPTPDNNPDTCIHDIWSLVRYPEGQAPELVREFYPSPEGVDFGRILNQDYSNLEDVQLGMHSRGFKGSRVNPVQEATLSNFHRVLRELLAVAPR